MPGQSPAYLVEAPPQKEILARAVRATAEGPCLFPGAEPVKEKVQAIVIEGRSGPGGRQKLLDLFDRAAKAGVRIGRAGGPGGRP